MLRRRPSLVLLLASVASIALLGALGCSPSKPEMVSQGPTALNDTKSAESDQSERNTRVNQSMSSDGDSEHGHVPGAHGGIMVSLGRDSYHIEAVVESGGTIRLYTLGKDETRVIDVESQTLKGFVKADGDTDSKAISFEPSPQEGDSPGKTSLFVGQLPKEMVGSKLDVTIPNFKIDGERFRLGFQTGQEGHSDVGQMPEKVADDAERDLYLTPGGRYTAADILANGNMTASQRFKAFKSVHDMNPIAGDRICPITQTKANPKCSWIIDGKSYQFCCPPCVDEFLASAKASSDPLPDPESFMKK